MTKNSPSRKRKVTFELPDSECESETREKQKFSLKKEKPPPRPIFEPPPLDSNLKVRSILKKTEFINEEPAFTSSFLPLYIINSVINSKFGPSVPNTYQDSDSEPSSDDSESLSDSLFSKNNNLDLESQYCQLSKRNSLETSLEGSIDIWFNSEEREVSEQKATLQPIEEKYNQENLDFIQSNQETLKSIDSKSYKIRRDSLDGFEEINDYLPANSEVERKQEENSSLELENFKGNTEEIFEIFNLSSQNSRRDSLNKVEIVTDYWQVNSQDTNSEQVANQNLEESCNQNKSCKKSSLNNSIDFEAVSDYWQVNSQGKTPEQVVNQNLEESYNQKSSCKKSSRNNSIDSEAVNDYWKVNFEDENAEQVSNQNLEKSYNQNSSGKNSSRKNSTGFEAVSDYYQLSSKNKNSQLNQNQESNNNNLNYINSSKSEGSSRKNSIDFEPIDDYWQVNSENKNSKIANPNLEEYVRNSLDNINNSGCEVFKRKNSIDFEPVGDYWQVNPEEDQNSEKNLKNSYANKYNSEKQEPTSLLNKQSYDTTENLSLILNSALIIKEKLRGISGSSEVLPLNSEENRNSDLNSRLYSEDTEEQDYSHSYNLSNSSSRQSSLDDFEGVTDYWQVDSEEEILEYKPLQASSKAERSEIYKEETIPSSDIYKSSFDQVVSSSNQTKSDPAQTSSSSDYNSDGNLELSESSDSSQHQHTDCVKTKFKKKRRRIKFSVSIEESGYDTNQRETSDLAAHFSNEASLQNERLRPSRNNVLELKAPEISYFGYLAEDYFEKQSPQFQQSVPSCCESLVSVSVQCSQPVVIYYNTYEKIRKDSYTQRRASIQNTNEFDTEDKENHNQILVEGFCYTDQSYQDQNTTFKELSPTVKKPLIKTLEDPLTQTFSTHLLSSDTELQPNILQPLHLDKNTNPLKSEAIAPSQQSPEEGQHPSTECKRSSRSRHRANRKRIFTAVRLPGDRDPTPKPPTKRSIKPYQKKSRKPFSIIMDNMEQLNCAGEPDTLSAHKRDDITEKNILIWIYNMIDEPARVDYEFFLKDGCILCKLMNRINPGCIPEEEITWEGVRSKQKNIANFLTQAEKYGVPKAKLFYPEDILHLRHIPRVTRCIYALAKIAQEDPALGPNCPQLGDEPNFAAPPKKVDIPGHRNTKEVLSQIATTMQKKEQQEKKATKHSLYK